jgi:hypothetical protein
VFAADHWPRAEKNELKPWQQKMWCIPPESDAEFVCAMEHVLAVYRRPPDASRPLVCFDEKSKQLVGEITKPIPAACGQFERHDYEYVRKGTANLFMFVAPLQGWLNIAECELSVLEKQCLGERIEDESALRERVAHWTKDRNKRNKKIDWQFTTAAARIKLRRLYPQTQME